MSKATEPVASGHKKSIEFFGQVLITRVELAGRENAADAGRCWSYIG